MRLILFFLCCVTVLASCDKQQPPIATHLLGDSHMARFDHQYWLPNRMVTNHGISGLQIEELIAEMPPVGNSTCILQIGTNDVLKMVANGATDQQVIQLLNNRCKMLLDTIGKVTARAYMFEILPPANQYLTGRQLGGIYKMVNTNLRNYAATTNHCIILPIHRLIDEKNYSLKDQLTNDRLHLNHNGYEIFSQIIYQYVH